jgi:hypothetical protein
MRVLVTGSRTWSDAELVFSVLDHWNETVGIDTIIEGCALGADQMAYEWARERNVGCESYPADWHNFGKSAGPRRNSQMLIEGKPDLVIAFHDDLRNSVGTGDMVHKAVKAGIEVVPVSHARIDDA